MTPDQLRELIEKSAASWEVQGGNIRPDENSRWARANLYNIAPLLLELWEAANGIHYARAHGAPEDLLAELTDTLEGPLTALEEA